MTDQIRAAILHLALQRGRAKTFCPSEVAKTLSPDWRPLMPRVRAVAAGMSEIVMLQAGIEADPEAVRGPIRLRLR